MRALRANRAGVDLIVAFAHPRDEDPGVWFFASTHSHSAAGESMAKAVAHTMGLDIVGRAIPMLKDTRSPAVVIATDPLDGTTGGFAAQGLINLFATSHDA